MRHRLVLLLSILITAVVLVACNGVNDHIANSNTAKANNVNLGPEITYPDGVRRVTTDELEAMMKSGEAFVVDVRSQDSYDVGHIPGAKLIPAGEIANHLNELPRDKMIVTYCS